MQIPLQGTWQAAHDEGPNDPCLLDCGIPSPHMWAGLSDWLLATRSKDVTPLISLQQSDESCYR